MHDQQREQIEAVCDNSPASPANTNRARVLTMVTGVQAIAPLAPSKGVAAAGISTECVCTVCASLCGFTECAEVSWVACSASSSPCFVGACSGPKQLVWVCDRLIEVDVHPAASKHLILYTRGFLLAFIE